MLLDLEPWCSIPVLSTFPCPGRAGLACRTTRAVCLFSTRLKVTDRSLQAFKQHIRMRLLTDWHCLLSCMASQRVACPLQPRDSEQHSCLAPVQSQNLDPAMKKIRANTETASILLLHTPKYNASYFSLFLLSFLAVA